MSRRGPQFDDFVNIRSAVNPGNVMFLVGGLASLSLDSVIPSI